jgi:hypothetical protein
MRSRQVAKFLYPKRAFAAIVTLLIAFPKQAMEMTFPQPRLLEYFKRARETEPKASRGL